MGLRYHKATLKDLDLLVHTRVQVLLAANGLPEETDMTAVETASRDYYRAALSDGSHAAWLVFDGDTWIGAGGVSFYQIIRRKRDLESYPSTAHRYPVKLFCGFVYKCRILLFHPYRCTSASYISCDLCQILKMQHLY